MTLVARYCNLELYAPHKRSAQIEHKNTNMGPTKRLVQKFVFFTGSSPEHRFKSVVSKMGEMRAG